MKNSLLTLAALAALLVPLFGQRATPPWKGIWEPISYPEDIHFFDAFFTTADEGWVVGGRNDIAGGIILHTSDGGDHWEVQFGDPQSSDRAVKDLRFLDQTHGWAVQSTGGAASRLLHTRDGKLWTVAGGIDVYHKDYMFTSESAGVSVSRDVITKTMDGGRSWQPVFACAAKVQVNGLYHNVSCEWQRLQFVTPDIAYAIALSKEAPMHLFLAKTSDGGSTWTMATQDLTGSPGDVFFTDQTTGYLRTGGAAAGQLYNTSDGGNTWTGMATSPGNRIQFADPEVGWAVLYRKVSFTTDGGDHWNSREYPFPAVTWAFSLPRRDRGYVVGEHGMIYRYRIVPIEYTGKGVFPAPLLSGIDSPLDAQAQQLAQQVQRMAQDLGAGTGAFPQDTAIGTGALAQSNAPGGVASSPFLAGIPGCAAPPLRGAPINPTATAGAGFVQDSGTASPATGGVSQASGGGFVQDTNAAQSPPAGSFSQTGGGFAQDTTTAAATLNSVSATAPQFVSRYRNLNLLSVGMQMSTQLPATIDCLKQSFQLLRNTKDPQAALPLINNLRGQSNGLVQLVRLAFQKQK